MFKIIKNKLENINNINLSKLILINKIELILVYNEIKDIK